MSTQQPARRRSARLAFANEAETRSPSASAAVAAENGAPQAKRQRRDEAKLVVNGKTTTTTTTTTTATTTVVGGGAGTGGGRTRSKKMASYDEEDDGFRFTRTRAKKVKAAAAARTIPEAVAEEEEATTARAEEARESRRATASKPRAKRKSNEEASGAKNEVKEPERPLSSSRRQDAVEDGAEGIPNRTETEDAQQQVVVAATIDDNTQMIALPFSDTPVIKRNKEFRRRASKGHRRSSTGMRGRRASSLIESGSDALPHSEVPVTEFYKHIASEGLSEPRRMKQLLTWCGARALDDHHHHHHRRQAPHASSSSSEDATSLAAMPILRELVRDFSKRSEMSDWFARQEPTPSSTSPPPPSKTSIKKPNPRNVANLAKIEELEERLKRLQEERRTWETLSKQPSLASLALSVPVETTTAAATANTRTAAAGGSGSKAPVAAAAPAIAGPLAPSFASSSSSTSKEEPSSKALISSSSIPHPCSTKEEEEEDLDAAAPIKAGGAGGGDLDLRPSTEASLARMTGHLEFTVDRFRHGTHRVAQYQSTAERLAERVLADVARALERRESEQRTRAGTSELPVVEVLRGISRLDR